MNYNLEFRKLLKLSLIVAFISTAIISYDNVYRPDAGLYHLPYIQILQENKILIGLTNLYVRFGHTSIIQYLSAIYNNSLTVKKYNRSYL